MEHLTQLCEDLQIDPLLEKTEDGFFIFPVQDKLQVKVKPLDPGVYLNCPIANCPELKKEELFIYLMKANLFGQGTLGSAIGLQPQENLLTLSSILAYDMDYRDFKESIEDFANIVTFWRDEVDRHEREAKSGIL